MSVPHDPVTSLLAGYAMAVAIGIGFGATLEQAGLGSARKLSGQFYLSDFTVVKVMFSAILTAMLGLFWLDLLGVTQWELIHMPETFLAPQVMGGVVFGLGFALAGLCPGTSCVAAATGRVDGAMTAFGLLAGVVVTGLAFPALEPFYESTPFGALDLAMVTGLPKGIVVLIVTGIALGAFHLIGRREAQA